MAQISKPLTRLSILVLVLCVMFSSVIPAGAAKITGLDAVSVSEGTEDASKGTITSTLDTGTSNTNTHTKTMTLTGDSAALGSAAGTLKFKVTYTLSANDVTMATDGKAGISASSGITSATVNPGKKTETNTVTIENWKAGSMWTVTMTASASRNALGGKTASTVSVTISEIDFEEYLKESVTFMGMDMPYTVSYYADAATTTLSTQTVPAGSTGTAVTAALIRGMSISASDYYYCTDVQADRSGTTITLANTANFTPKNGDVITPTFYQDWDKDGIAPFLVNGENGWNWEHALSIAGNSGTIVLNEDYTFTEGTYNIPSGVTFLVPYSSSDFTIHSTTKTDSSGGMKSTLKYANTKLVCAGMDGENAVRPKLLLPDVDVTYILTIPSATTLNVEKGGKFVVGGTIASGNRSTAGISCATAGAHSNVQLEGTLNLNGDMSVCGYILGDGQVNVNSGATVYQPYTAMDFIAGPVVIRCKEDSTFPFYRYAMTNIQSNMRIHSGGNVRGYVSLFTAEIKVLGIGFENQYNVTEFDLISDTGLVRLNSGSTLDLVYDADHYANDTDTNHRDLGMYHRVGKTTMTFTGGMTFGSTSLVVKVQGTDYPVDSTGDHFVIPYNYDIILNNGTYNVANPLKLLPGANMTVNSGATVQISNGGSLAIMSGLRDRRVYGAATSDENAWYNEHYPSTDVLRAEPFKGNGSANLILNGGTLQVDSGASFGGLVQTTGTGSVIMNGTNETQVRIGVLREKNEALGHQAGRGLYDLTAQLYARNGNLITLESGKRYTAVDNAPNVVESYSYEYFASCDSDTTTSDTQPLNATVIGTWQCATEEQHIWSDATCTAPKTCSVCGATEGEKLGHDMQLTSEKVEAKCEVPGKEAVYTCANGCGHVTGGAEIPALEHDMQLTSEKVEAKCEVPGKEAVSTCANGCGKTEGGEEIPATGHNYNAVVTAPTCTAAGYTTYTCACGDSYVADEVAALGHDYAAAETKAPTCTEAGVMTYTCDCGDTYTEEIAAKGHTLTQVEAKAPTCTETGYEAYEYCSACDYTTYKEVEATGHSFKMAGNGTQKCKNCEATLSAPGCTFESWTGSTADNYYFLNGGQQVALGVVQPQLGVKFWPEENVADSIYAAYPSDGYITFTNITNAEALANGCYLIGNRANAIDTWYVQPLAGKELADGKAYPAFSALLNVEGSTYQSIVDLVGEWMIATVYLTEEAMEANPGLVVKLEPRMYYDQNTYWNFGVVYSYMVEVHEHSLTKVDAKNATCETNGNIEHYKCSGCEQLFSDENGENAVTDIVIPATGHSYGAPVWTWTGNDSDGYTAATATFDCEKCDDVQKVDTTVSSATTDGKTVYTAEVIFEEKIYTDTKTVEIAEHKHSYVEEITKEATCVEAGERTFTCSGCGDSYTEVIPATGEHTPGEAVVENIVNGTSENLPQYDSVSTCTVCGAETRETVVLSQNVFIGMSMNLNDSLEVKFGVYEGMLNGDDHYAKITRVYAKNNTSDTVERKQSDWLRYNNRVKTFAYTDIAACQMIDMFYVTLYNSEGKIVGVYMESIRDYAMRKIVEEENKGDKKNVKYLTMFVDMLNYGAEAQRFFKYPTENPQDLANNRLTEAQQNYASTSSEGKDIQVKGTGLLGVSLSLESRIELNFVFDKNVVTKDMRAVLTYENLNGEQVTKSVDGAGFLNYKNSGWRMYIDMPVALGGQIVTCTIYDGETNVTSAQDSVESYLTRKHNDDTLFPATMKFIKSAAEYFS